MNSNCDKTKKWTQIVTKLKKNHTVAKLKNYNCDKTQQIKMWQLKKSNCEEKKLKKSNCDKNQFMTNL